MMKERLALKLKKIPYNKHFWDSGTHWILGSPQAQKKQPTFFKGLKTHTRKKTLVKQNGLKKKTVIRVSALLPPLHPKNKNKLSKSEPRLKMPKGGPT